MKKIRFLSILVFLFTAGNSQAWIFAPENENSCIKKYSKNIRNEDVSRWVVQLCYMYFSESSFKKKKGIECSIEEAADSKNLVTAKQLTFECFKKYE